MAKTIDPEKIKTELEKGTLPEQIEVFKTVKSWLSEKINAEAERLSDLSSQFQQQSENL